MKRLEMGLIFALYNLHTYKITGFLKWNPVRLSAWQKGLNVDLLLIPEFVNSEMRITSAKISLKWPLFWIHESRNKNWFNIEVFCQAARISFRKTSIDMFLILKATQNDPMIFISPLMFLCFFDDKLCDYELRYLNPMSFTID